MRKSNVKIVKVNNGVIKIPMTIHFRNRLFRFFKTCEREAHNCKGGEENIKILVTRILREIDKVFGQGASEKIFGSGDVTPDAIVQFSDGLNALLKKWNEEGAVWR